MREQRTESAEVFGSYLVYERIGMGGMATVHRAKKRGIEGFERPVALKRLLSHLASDSEFVRAFVREARVASMLRHTNIAQTYDLGRVEGTYYIAMELVVGRDLREILRHIAYSVGPMPVPLVLNVIYQLCDALDYAHTMVDEQGKPLGIVHRDVSPANVLLGGDGTCKLIDFGIAKATASTLHTQTGRLKGKFSYMAPEILEGATVDARADLFAVGVIAYELLTAQPLFTGSDDMDTLLRVRGRDVPAPSTINRHGSKDLDAVVMTALARNPTQRWQTAAQLRGAIDSLASRPGMRASGHDLARWLDWAFTQPASSRRWDESATSSGSGLAELAAVRRVAAHDDPSIVMEWTPQIAPPAVGAMVARPASLGSTPQTTRPMASIGGPVIASGPVASTARTVMVDPRPGPPAGHVQAQWPAPASTSGAGYPPSSSPSYPGYPAAASGPGYPAAASGPGYPAAASGPAYPPSAAYPPAAVADGTGTRTLLAAPASAQQQPLELPPPPHGLVPGAVSDVAHARTMVPGYHMAPGLGGPIDLAGRPTMIPVWESGRVRPLGSSAPPPQGTPGGTPLTRHAGISPADGVVAPVAGGIYRIPLPAPAETQPQRAHDVVYLPTAARSGSRVGAVVVVVLCAIAAAGGYFAVSHFAG